MTSTVDIFICTVLPEEYSAVLSHLEDVEHYKGTRESPNRYSWKFGKISNGNSFYKVVVARAPHAGTLLTSLAFSKTLDQFSPRFTFFVGIAGGIKNNGVKQGDVIVSDVIYGYEYGKISHGFEPRYDLTYRSDSSLLTLATATNPNWIANINLKPPRKRQPNVICGPVASGNKVIDVLTNSYVKPILKAWPKTVAVEMEGLGAAAAVTEARDAGFVTSYLMVRSVSDLPKEHSDSGQTQSRDKWKKYAADVAATFVVNLARHGLPIEPHSSRAEPVLNDQVIEEAIVCAVNAIRILQNSDGGIPATKPKQESGVWTTASCLEAFLVSPRHPSGTVTCMGNMIEFLLANQPEDDGWPLISASGNPSTFATGHVLSAFCLASSHNDLAQYSERLAYASKQAVSWLESASLKEGGWGLAPGAGAEGNEFRIAGTFYAIRGLTTAGANYQNSEIIRDAVTRVVSLQCDDGGWPYVRGYKVDRKSSVSNTARAIYILISTGYAAPRSSIIEKGVNYILDHAYKGSWALGTESFYAERSQAQNVYHNNTPCDAIEALILAGSISEKLDQAIEWIMNNQRDDGIYELASPDQNQSYYDAWTWPTSEFIHALSTTLLEKRS